MKLDRKFAIAFGLGFLWLLVWEVYGIYHRGPGDTITETWVWTGTHLPGPLSWLFLVLTMVWFANLTAWAAGVIDEAMLVDIMQQSAEMLLNGVEE